MAEDKKTGSGVGVSQKSAQFASGAPDASVSKQLFISSALNMSWQMAIAVLLPVVGGYYLGKHFKANPWLTLLGLALAVALVALIVRQTIRNLPGYAKPKGTTHES